MEAKENDTNPAHHINRIKSDISGLLGMHEMEHAARIIIQLAKYAGSWDLTSLCLSQFPPGDSQTGFLQLMAHGWIDPHPLFKNSFKPSVKLIERLSHPAKGENP